MKTVVSPHLIWLALAVLCVLGCQQRDAIRHYEVRKPQPTRRMLGADRSPCRSGLVLQGGGARESLDSQADGFVALIKSLRFGDQPEAGPQWTLPDGWSQKTGSGFRFATIEIPSAQDRLELSVSQLPVPAGDRTEYVLSNVNLWREQMGLTPIGTSDLDSSAPQIALADHPDTKAYLVDLTGYPPRGGGHGGMAGGGSMTAPAAAPAAAESQLAYQVPAEWTQGQLTISRGGIQVRRNAAFEVREGDKRAEITVTSLPAESNPILSNVNRWRQQIGLDPIAQDDLKRDAKQLSVGDLAADYVQIQGSDQTILGAILVRQDTAWFIKLQGDPELAERERDTFRILCPVLGIQALTTFGRSHLDPPWQLTHYRRNVFPTQLRRERAASWSSGLWQEIGVSRSPGVTPESRSFLFACSIFLILVGTLAQVEMDMWQVIDQYFRAWITWIDFQIFFPRSWFPNWQNVPGGFWFPGGATVGLALAINLIAAHLAVFTIQARGIRLGIGLVTLASGRRLHRDRHHQRS